MSQDAVTDNSQKGAATVELAMSFIPFALILFGLLQFLSWAHSTMVLHHSVAAAGRWASTGQIGTDANGNPLTRIDSIRQRVINEAGRLGLSAENLVVKVCPASNPTCTTESAGAPGRHFYLTARKGDMPLFSTAGLTPSASFLIRNEPV